MVKPATSPRERPEGWCPHRRCKSDATENAIANASGSPVPLAGRPRFQAVVMAGMESQLKVIPMPRYFRFTSRPSGLARLVHTIGYVFHHLVGEPLAQLSPVMSHRQQLAAAVEAARRLKRGGKR